MERSERSDTGHLLSPALQLCHLLIPFPVPIPKAYPVSVHPLPLLHPLLHAHLVLLLQLGIRVRSQNVTAKCPQRSYFAASLS